MSGLDIIFDLQEYLKDMPDGELNDGIFSTYGDSPPTIFVEQEEDVKVLRIRRRNGNRGGVELKLENVEGINVGDMLTIVGRHLGDASSQLFFGLAAFAEKDGIGKIAEHEAFANLYTLSFVTSGEKRVYLAITNPSFAVSKLDYFIDGVLVVRRNAFEVG